MKLHQLDNGNWIDPSRITAIKALDRVQCWEGGPTHGARVVVSCGTDVELVVCDDYAQAREMANAIAALVNAANV